MPCSRPPPTAVICAALAMAASPAVAQSSPDAIFRSYMSSGAVGALAPLQTQADGSETEAAATSDEREAGTVTPSDGWLGANRMYVLGGAAALTTGFLLSQQGSHAAVASAVVTPSLTVDMQPLPGVSTPAAPTTAATISTTTSTTVGVGGTGTRSGGTAGSVTVNPEPGTVLLMATGLVGVVAIARRKRVA